MKTVKVELLVIADCPNVVAAESLLRAELAAKGLADCPVTTSVIATQEEAQARRFSGSPTFLIDGRDPFSGPCEGTYSLACRVYPTPDGLRGLPEPARLRAALSAAMERRL